MAKTTTMNNQVDGKDQLLAAVLASLYAQNSKPDIGVIGRFLGLTYFAAEGRLRQPRKAAETMVEKAQKGQLPSVQAPKRKSAVNKVCKRKGKVGAKRNTKSKSARDDSSDNDLSVWENVLDYEATINPAEVEF
ncbi:hypothetical protein M409DRAFT_53154 [Zasmidium cellare ATCC 36951]|uniref:Uncharacterized protein n=1 Tax=Zasmidium cellare ATCC 36951 TaxID=1080233 RepID=A0A6A6CSP2_ZASCE|nr:uncharacterized protein M409DRAFT_53154 [Zasmidium cellare ATCC 36951]KAF2168486.1 hypothetical protein M409DRAFT_53154 [Zasmidium cellare ATCC 36951]